MRKGALLGIDRSGSRADRGIAEQPPHTPAEGGQRQSIDAEILQEERKYEKKGELAQQQESDFQCIADDQGRKTAANRNDQGTEPQGPGGNWCGQVIIEQLGEHMGMHFQPDHLAIVSPDIGESADRRLEPVTVDEVAADQNMLAGQEGAKHVRDLGIGKALDRKFVEHGNVGCGRDMIADSAVIAGEFRIGTGQRDGHEGRRSRVMWRPSPLHAVTVGFQLDIGRLHRVAADRLEKLLEKFMFGKADLRIFLWIGISEIGGGLHVAKG